MFEGREHDSFRLLCRGLRMERKWEEGDVFVEKNGLIGFWGDESFGRILPDELEELRRTAIWCPRSDQLDDMLEEAGVPDVMIAKDGLGWHVSAEFVAGQYAPATGVGPTREEAKLRLWCVVTGRAVSA